MRKGEKVCRSTVRKTCPEKPTAGFQARMAEVFGSKCLIETSFHPG